MRVYEADTKCMRDHFILESYMRLIGDECDPAAPRKGQLVPKSLHLGPMKKSEIACVDRPCQCAQPARLLSRCPSRGPRLRPMRAPGHIARTAPAAPPTSARYTCIRRTTTCTPCTQPATLLAHFRPDKNVLGRVVCPDARDPGHPQATHHRLLGHHPRHT